MQKFNKGQNFIPVKEGDEIDVTIEAVGEKGDGIAKKDGFVIFVPNTQKDQAVRIKVTRVLRKVGFGEVVGEAQSAPAQDQPTQAPAQAEPEAEPEPQVEDSEDFGEEEAEEQPEKQE